MKNYRELKSKLINNKNINIDVMVSTINELTNSLNLLPYGTLDFKDESELRSVLCSLLVKNNN